MDLEFLGNHSQARETRDRRRKIEGKYHAAVARLRVLEVDLQDIEAKVADDLANGDGEIGEEIEEARQAVEKAKLEVRVFKLALTKTKDTEQKALENIRTETQAKLLDPKTRAEIEAKLRGLYAQAVKDLNDVLTLAEEKNQTVHEIFCEAQALFGDNQTILARAVWNDLFPDTATQAGRLKTWRDYVQEQAHIDLE